MRKLKQYTKFFHQITFFLREKSSAIYSFKVWVLSLFDFLRVPKHNCSSRAIWKQVFYQRYHRCPEHTESIFCNTLRVCITYRCNLSCRYCYAKGMENKIPGDMSPKDFLRLINWMKGKGWHYIRLLGGEPTFHPEFAEILDICCCQKVYFSLSTNNIFSPQVGLKLNKPWLTHVTVNYVFSELDNERKSIFKYNLSQLSEKKIPFELSYIIGYQDNNWAEIFETVKLYKPVSLRVSIEVPGLAKQISTPGLIENFGLIYTKIFELQKNCLKQNVPFFVFRPLMPCMFSPGQWKSLKNIYKFVCFTRCPLGVKGDYSKTLVINPDFSILPCIAVFLKGPSIFSFGDRNEISDFYKKKIKEMLSEPLMESCKACDKHANFIGNLEKEKNTNLNSSYSDKICQAGCLSFKNSSQTLYCLE